MTPNLPLPDDPLLSAFVQLRYAITLLWRYVRSFAGRWGEAKRARAWRDLAAFEAMLRRYIRVQAEALTSAWLAAGWRPSVPYPPDPEAPPPAPRRPAGRGDRPARFRLSEAPPPAHRHYGRQPREAAREALRLEIDRLALLERIERMRPVLTRPERPIRRLALRLLRGRVPALRIAPQTRPHLHRLEPEIAGFLARLDALIHGEIPFGPPAPPAPAPPPDTS